MTQVEEVTRAQINRILQSDALRSSDGLRRLLKFLAEKSLSGEADQLKEYSIGVDAFGKPASYDPRQDSAVRIQVGRLRLKLTEYYQTQGKEDPVVVDLPKGRFKLQWQPRPQMEPVTSVSSPPAETPAGVPTSRNIPIAVSLCLLATFGWAAYVTARLQTERTQSAPLRAQWTPEIAALWGPFVDTPRPLLISISAPLFIDLPGVGFFRDLAVNHPEDIPGSAAINAIQKALHTPPPEPIIYFSTLGDADVSFRLGKFFAVHKPNVSVVNGSELSWRQMSENNAILIGSPKFFNQQLASMPVKTELLLEPTIGIRNLKPRDKEPAIFVDTYLQTRVTGTAYALVSHTPGPRGTGDVMSFSSRNGAAILGAAAWFTEPASVRSLIGVLTTSAGEVPRYYQVLLKVRFQDGVPLETSYVLHRQLRSR